MYLQPHSSQDRHLTIHGLLEDYWALYFLTGSLLLLPRLGAALTVVITVTGQILMGVVMGPFGLFGASQQQFTFLKQLGLFLIFGILLMNYVPNRKIHHKTNSNFILWLAIGLVFGSGTTDPNYN